MPKYFGKTCRSSNSSILTKGIKKRKKCHVNQGFLKKIEIKNSPTIAYFPTKTFARNMK